MGVAHERTELLDQPGFDRAIEPAAGRPVGIDDPLLAVRGAECLVAADGVRAEGLEVPLQGVQRRPPVSALELERKGI